MSIRSILVASCSEMVFLVRSFIRLLQWVAIIFVTGLVIRQHHNLSVQTVVAFGLMLWALLGISFLAKGQKPDRIEWIDILLGIVAVGIAAVFWIPQWSGYIVGVALVLFVFTPHVLARLARRGATGGYERTAAFYARLFCLFHPSRQARFEASFLTARAIGSIEGKIAAYRALASRATPQQSTLLNCYISIAQDDWEGVLTQSRSAGDTNGQKWFEIRALGELGHFDEMVMTYASAESVLPLADLPVCRLFVLAFGGRADAVRSLLSRQLRFLRPRNKAYWIFIADQKAETCDEHAQRILASYARATHNEFFRKTAQRHLDVGPSLGGAGPSTEAVSIIAAIERALGKKKRDLALTQ